jgi:hypothetical protein
VGVSVVVALCACGGGVAGKLPQDDITYGFQASVEVQTPTPTPGRRVDLVLAVTSIGNVPVECDVTLRVVSMTGTEIYSQRWESVKFQPEAPWNLQNGFLPATDVEKTYKLSVEVRRHTNGELLYDNPDVARLDFPMM